MGKDVVLVISQTQQIHEEIADLLAKPRKAKPPAGPQRPGNRQQPWQGPPVGRGGGGGGGGMFRYDPDDAPPPAVWNGTPGKTEDHAAYAGWGLIAGRGRLLAPTESLLGVEDRGGGRDDRVAGRGGRPCSGPDRRRQ